jgi:hypothetical protein
MQNVTLLGPEETGLGPNISGDPFLALVAQVNRFVGRKAGPDRAFPLSAALLGDFERYKVKVIASNLFVERYSDTFLVDLKKLRWAIEGSKPENVEAFVQANLTEIVQTLALYGDKLGLEPATYGVTARDPRMPALPMKVGAKLALAGGLLVAVGALAYFVIPKVR